MRTKEEIMEEAYSEREEGIYLMSLVEILLDIRDSIVKKDEPAEETQYLKETILKLTSALQKKDNEITELKKYQYSVRETSKSDERVTIIPSGFKDVFVEVSEFPDYTLSVNYREK